MNDDFIHFGLSHWTALAVTVLGAIMMCRYMRSGASDHAKNRVCIIFGCLLLFAVFFDPVIVFNRYGMGDTGWRLFWNSALPLYLCDIVSIIAALALFTRRPYLTEMAFLWGLAGTTQGLITPTLRYNWNSIDYYNFFLQHGGVPIAAITLVWGLKIYPRPGAFKRAMLWSWLYMAVVMLINILIKQNYGFLNAKPGTGTMFDYMGPYPWYLLTLQAIAFTLYFILLKIAPKHQSIDRT